MKFQTTMAAPKAVVMSEAEMFAAAEAFEQFHDSVVNGEDATALEVFENLTVVKDMINSKMYRLTEPNRMNVPGINGSLVPFSIIPMIVALTPAKPVIAVINSNIPAIPVTREPLYPG